MKCECGKNIEIKIGSKIIAKGCKILTAMTIVVTVQCEKGGSMFQVPIKSDGVIVKKGSNTEYNKLYYKTYRKKYYTEIL